MWNDIVSGFQDAVRRFRGEEQRPTLRGALSAVPMAHQIGAATRRAPALYLGETEDNRITNNMVANGQLPGSQREVYSQGMRLAEPVYPAGMPLYVGEADGTQMIPIADEGGAFSPQVQYRSASNPIQGGSWSYPGAAHPIQGSTPVLQRGYDPQRRR